jgi:hypothetical protein
MTGYLAYSIYSYLASFVSWRIEKIYKEQNDEQKVKIFFVLKHGLRISGTILLLAHLLS